MIHTYINDFRKNLDGLTIRVFTLVNINSFDLKEYDLCAFLLKFNYDNGVLYTTHQTKFYVPLDKTKLFKGSILNIRSEINTANLTGKYKYVEGSGLNVNSYFPIVDKVNEFYAYITTILIELDPL